MKFESKTILGVPIIITPKDKLLRHLGETSSRSIIFTPNPEILVEAHRNNSFKKILQSATINIPDGVGVAKLIGVPEIKGRIFFAEILKLLTEHKKQAVFLTGSKSVLDKSIAHAKSEHQGLKVVGFVGPKLNMQGEPINAEQEKREQKIIKKIKALNAFVFVGFGAPKQERWVIRFKDELKDASFMAVGGTFDTYSGLVKAPPEIFSLVGAEWLWRLVREPKRIGRIFNAVIVFPLLFLLDNDKR